MDWPCRTAACVCVALLSCAACGETASGTPDGGAMQDVTRRDAVRPPDVTLGDDGIPANSSLGRPCDPARDSADCTGGAVCFDPHGSATGACDLNSGAGCGVCALKGCTLEDIETPSIEDDCPQMTRAGKSYRSACARVPLATSGAGKASTVNLCLPTCTPSPDSNSCAAVIGHAGLACDPASIFYTGHSEVCLFAACERDSDCGNGNPVSPDSVCHKASATCGVLGAKNGTIGAPCSVSADCGPDQFCYPEQTLPSGKTIAEGGYCTLVGCKYAKSYGSLWSCPGGSKCFMMGSGHAVSFCLAVGCDSSQPAAKDNCRDEAKDPTQYQCIDSVCWIAVPSKKND